MCFRCLMPTQYKQAHIHSIKIRVLRQPIGCWLSTSEYAWENKLTIIFFKFTSPVSHAERFNMYNSHPGECVIGCIIQTILLVYRAAMALIALPMLCWKVRTFHHSAGILPFCEMLFQYILFIYFFSQFQIVSQCSSNTNNINYQWNQYYYSISDSQC